MQLLFFIAQVAENIWKLGMFRNRRVRTDTNLTDVSSQTADLKKIRFCSFVYNFFFQLHKKFAHISNKTWQKHYQQTDSIIYRLNKMITFYNLTAIQRQ